MQNHRRIARISFVWSYFLARVHSLLLLSIAAMRINLASTALILPSIIGTKASTQGQPLFEAVRANQASRGLTVSGLPGYPLWKGQKASLKEALKKRNRKENSEEPDIGILDAKSKGNERATLAVSFAHRDLQDTSILYICETLAAQGLQCGCDQWNGYSGIFACSSSYCFEEIGVCGEVLLGVYDSGNGINAKYCFSPDVPRDHTSYCTTYRMSLDDFLYSDFDLQGSAQYCYHHIDDIECNSCTMQNVCPESNPTGGASAGMCLRY
jgi:hypothetical protein